MIQVMRLQYYEGFSRYFSGDGHEFAPLRCAGPPAQRGDAVTRGGNRSPAPCYRKRSSIPRHDANPRPGTHSHPPDNPRGVFHVLARRPDVLRHRRPDRDRPLSGAAPGAALRPAALEQAGHGRQLLVFVGAQFGLLLLGINEVFARRPWNWSRSPRSAPAWVWPSSAPASPPAVHHRRRHRRRPHRRRVAGRHHRKAREPGPHLIYLGLAEGIAIYGLVISSCC
jgi:hypothetical protein